MVHGARWRGGEMERWMFDRGERERRDGCLMREEGKERWMVDRGEKGEGKGWEVR